MPENKFEKSLAEGVHHQLHTLIGKWEGPTKTWFEAGVLADESPMTGTIRPILGGRFVIHEYSGSLNGKPFEGLAIYGYNLDTGKFQCAWIDSFHMSTGILFSEDKKSTDNFNVLGSYEMGDVRWGWRTEIEIVDKDHITITAYNIIPEEGEAKATETMYQRSK